MTAYPHRTAKPVHGERALLTPSVPPENADPALEGRYFVRWSPMDEGSRVASGGSPKNTPVKVAMPAAVFLNSAPRVTPIRPDAVM